MSSDADADRVVQAVLESGDRPLRSVLGAMDRGASGKAKQLMEQLDGQLRVICVPGRSSKSIASEILHVTRICASSLSKVLGKQKSEKLDAALDNWKADATNAVHDSLSTLREEMADRARLHGTISDDRIAKMQKAAQRNAMSSAERQVWNFLGPQLMQANDRIAELEGAMEALRQKARDAERTVTSCVDSASEQTKLMHSQIMEMTDALEKKHILWQRQRQRNVEFENRISEMQRQAAEAAKAAERKQRNYQADIKELNKTIAALDPTRNGGVPLKKLVEVVEAQLGLPVQVDTPMIIRLSACHRTIGDAPELAGWHTIGTRQKAAALAAVLGVETGWPVQERVGNNHQHSAIVSAPPSGRPMMPEDKEDSTVEPGLHEQTMAAKRIQCVYRGRSTRLAIKVCQLKHESAIRIQRHRRGQVDRRHADYRRRQAEQAQVEAREARNKTLLESQQQIEHQLRNIKVMTTSFESIVIAQKFVKKLQKRQQSRASGNSAAKPVPEPEPEPTGNSAAKPEPEPEPEPEPKSQSGLESRQARPGPQSRTVQNEHLDGKERSFTAVSTQTAFSGEIASAAKLLGVESDWEARCSATDTKLISMTTRAEVAEGREKAAEQKCAELHARSTALVQQAQNSEGQAEVARKKMAAAMSSAATAASEVKQLMRHIETLRQDKQELEEKFKDHRDKQVAREEEAYVYERSNHAKSWNPNNTEFTDPAMGETDDTSHSGFKAGDNAAPEPEAVLLAISGDQDDPQQIQHKSTSDGANPSQSEKQHSTLAGVLPPRTPRRAALETLSEAGFLATTSSFPSTSTSSVMPQDPLLQVDLGALGSQFVNAKGGPLGPMTFLPPQPPPRPNLPSASTRPRVPPPQRPMMPRMLRMAPVAPAALPDRLQFPDYKLSHRPSSVRYGEERARAESARTRIRTPKGLPRVPMDLRAISSTAR